MRKQSKVAPAILVVLAGVAFVIWSSRRATPVDIAPVDERKIAEVYVATGRVRSLTVASVGSELAGRIATVHVVEGARPTSGAPLVDLQPLDEELSVRRAEAQVEIAKKELGRVQQGSTQAQLARARADIASAEADVRQAEQELSRTEALTSGGVGTPAQLDRARTDLSRARSRLAVAKANLAELRQPARATDIKVAQARIDEAEANLAQTKAALGKTTISSPFDGLVLRVDAAPGENVSPGQALITVARTDAMEVYAEVDEDYFVRIAPGQKGTLVFPSVPEQTFGAKVSRVGPEVDPNRGVVGVHLDPETLPKFVVPGLTVDVAVELKQVEGRAVLRSAVIRDGAVAYVFVVADGEALRRDVEVLAEGEEYLAIDGLAESEVIARATEVSAGDRVRVREAR